MPPSEECAAMNVAEELVLELAASLPDDEPREELPSPRARCARGHQRPAIAEAPPLGTPPASPPPNVVDADALHDSLAEEYDAVQKASLQLFGDAEDAPAAEEGAEHGGPVVSAITADAGAAARAVSEAQLQRGLDAPPIAVTTVPEPPAEPAEVRICSTLAPQPASPRLSGAGGRPAPKRPLPAVASPQPPAPKRLLLAVSSPQPPVIRRRTFHSFCEGENVALLGIVMQVYPLSHVVCSKKEQVPTSNVIFVDDSGERIRVTFWRALSQWAQRLCPGDVVHVGQVKIKMYKGQLNGDVANGSGVRVCQRLRPGGDDPPPRQGPSLLEPRPELLAPLVNWVRENQPALLQPLQLARPTRPRPGPPVPSGPIDFASSLAEVPPHAATHARFRVLAVPPEPREPPAVGQAGRRWRRRAVVVVADSATGRPLRLCLWEEHIARLLPLLRPGRDVELFDLVCFRDSDSPFSDSVALHTTARTSGCPLHPDDPAAAHLAAAFDPPPAARCPSLAGLPSAGLAHCPALLSALRLPDDVPWTGEAFGEEDGLPAAHRAVRAACTNCSWPVAPSSQGVYTCGRCPPPLCEERALRWEFRPATALLWDHAAPEAPPLRATLQPAAVAALLGVPDPLRRVVHSERGPCLPQGAAAYAAAAADAAARLAPLARPWPAAGAPARLLSLAVRTRADEAGFPLEHAVDVLDVGALAAESAYT